MTDILKRIMNPASNSNDPDGNLLDEGPWSEQAAEARAKALGITLSDDHWNAVLFARDYYRGRGEQASAREMLNAMSEEFAEDGGRRWLFKLFPGGPVIQACKIAGVPVPDDAADPAFGSIH